MKCVVLRILTLALPLTAFAATKTYNDLGWEGDAEFWTTSGHAGVSVEETATTVSGGVEFRAWTESDFVCADRFDSDYKPGLLIIFR